MKCFWNGDEIIQKWIVQQDFYIFTQLELHSRVDLVDESEIEKV